MREQAEPIRIRGHTLLCLQGFRGLGYNEAFTGAMAALHRKLGEEPRTLILPIATPDDLCGHCPHLKGGCTLQGPDHERHMAAQDRTVLQRLGLEPGVVVAWAEVLERIRRSIAGADLAKICTTCPWLSLGYCAQGIEALK